MKTRSLNWPVWAGLLLSVVAFFSYFFVFVRFPITRDFPWASLLLFGVAAALLLVGVRRAFAPERRLGSKVAGLAAATLAVAVFGFFVFTTFIMSRWMPAAQGAPQIGQKAPDFSLSDTDGKPVSLSELLSTPVNGKAPKGVLLVFYRGYW
jgi:AhpC/TSA family